MAMMEPAVSKTDILHVVNIETTAVKATSTLVRDATPEQREKLARSYPSIRTELSPEDAVKAALAVMKIRPDGSPVSTRHVDLMDEIEPTIRRIVEEVVARRLGEREGADPRGGNAGSPPGQVRRRRNREGN